MLVGYGLQIIELLIYLQGQLVVVYFVYDSLFDGFVFIDVCGNLLVCQVWVVEQLWFVVQVSQCLGLIVYVMFFGVLVWFYFYLWLQCLLGLVEEVFVEFGCCWCLILDVFDVCGVDLCFEFYFGEDLYDGVIFECFFDVVDYYLCVKILYDFSYLLLQQMDYFGFIDCYYVCIGIFYVKDVEYCFSVCSGVYVGYQDWIDCLGCFCLLGDGQIDFKVIFLKFVQYDFLGWVVLEWECCLKYFEDGVCEGVVFICDYIIYVIECVFDDFVGSDMDVGLLCCMLGI